MTDAKEKIQGLLSSAHLLLEEARKIAAENDLSFDFIGDRYHPTDEPFPEPQSVDVWHSSWSPGC